MPNKHWITIFPNTYSLKKQYEGNMSLTSIASLISQTRAPLRGWRKETRDKGPLDKNQQKTQLPFIIMSGFGDIKSDSKSLRWGGNLLWFNGVEADHDDGMTFSEGIDLMTASGVPCVIAQSSSWTPDNQSNFRVLVPLSRRYEIDDMREIAAGQAEPTTQAIEELKRLKQPFVSAVNGILRGELCAASWSVPQGFYLGTIDGRPFREAIVLNEDRECLDERSDLMLGRIEKPGAVTHPLISISYSKVDVSDTQTPYVIQGDDDLAGYVSKGRGHVNPNFFPLMGFEFHLGQLGEHIHGPLFKAICSYVIEHQDFDRYDLIDKCQTALYNCGGDEGDVRAKMDERYLNAEIDSALRWREALPDQTSVDGLLKGVI